ncbi:MAG: ATP-binding protein [Promethearchaeota archaeon]
MKSIKLKTLITKYAAVISVGLILIFSGYLTIADIDERQTSLGNKTNVMVSQVGDAIQNEIQKRIDILMMFKDIWLTVLDIESCLSKHRFETRIPSFYNITPGFKAINWIDVNGTIRWVYPYADNFEVENKSIIYLKGDIFNTGFEYAQDTGNMGVMGIIELYQGGYGFTTYIPLYYKGTLTGYLNGVFDLNILFSEILKIDYGFVGIDQFSVDIVSEDLISNDDDTINPDEFVIYHKNENFTQDAFLVYTREIFILETFNLTLSIQPTIEFRNKLSIWNNSSILILGISLAVIVGILVQSLLKRNELLNKSSSEKEKLMQELHIRQKMESLGTLAGGIAHDFNNLLAGIQGNVSLIDFNLKTLQDDLRKDIKGPNLKLFSEIESDLNEIQTIIKNSGKAINQITQFSHSPSLELKPLNIEPMVYDLLKGFRKMIDRRIATVADLAGEEIYLFGDESRFNQILLNLCINSRDAIGSNTGEIKIETRIIQKLNTPKIPTRVNFSHFLVESSELYDKGYELEIKISDTGAGIPKDIVQKIFDPFFSTKGKSRHGTGLGLTIVYNSVESMDGTISIVSEVGKGSTFFLNFPILNREYFPQILETEILSDLEEDLQFDFQNLIILLVDDEKLIRKSLQLYLQHFGATIYTSDNGTKGLQLFQSFPKQFDLVILDINLPGMNGIDVYQIIKKIAPKQPVLFITGFSDYGIPPQDENDLGLMTKPFNLTDLAKKIHNKLI